MILLGDDVRESGTSSLSFSPFYAAVGSPSHSQAGGLVLDRRPPSSVSPSATRRSRYIHASISSGVDCYSGPIDADHSHAARATLATHEAPESVGSGRRWSGTGAIRRGAGGSKSLTSRAGRLPLRALPTDADCRCDSAGSGPRRRLPVCRYHSDGRHSGRSGAAKGN